MELMLLGEALLLLFIQSVINYAERYEVRVSRRFLKIKLLLES